MNFDFENCKSWYWGYIPDVDKSVGNQLEWPKRQQAQLCLCVGSACKLESYKEFRSEKTWPHSAYYTNLDT